MARSRQQEEDKGPRLPPPIERRVGLSRLALYWERLWPALWPALAILGAYALLGLTGFLTSAPLWLHWLIWIAAASAITFLLWLRRHVFRYPSREEGLRRMERLSGLPHRPLSAYADEAAPGTGDTELWAAHRNWIAERIAGARPGRPRASLIAGDPFALRIALIALLVTGGVMLGAEAPERLARAFWPGFGQGGTTTKLDAWVSPPAYTGRAPVFLTRQEKERDTYTVPQGSVLTLRVHGPGPRPSYEIGDGPETALRELAPGTFEAAVDLDQNAYVSLRRAGRRIGAWEFAVTPDQPPAIAFAEPPENTARNTLRLAYGAKDDYGVKSVEAHMQLDPSVALHERTLFQQPGTDPILDRPVKQQEGETEDEAAARHEKEMEARERFFMPPPGFSLPLPGVRPREVTHQVFRDFTSHPWAGLPVTLWLVAEDDAGQTGLSEKISLTLPARIFDDPLAAAIAEQRRRLVLNPRSRMSVAGFLSAFTQDLERHNGDPKVFLGLRAAYWRIAKARRMEDMAGVPNLLWDIALHIEDGDLSLAESDLRNAREELARKLSEGASDEEIEAAMDALKDALARYMDALSERMGEMAENMPDMPQNPDMQTIERGDLERMLDMIENLARTGAHDKAQDMLAQLDQMLENLQTGDPSQQAQTPNPLSRALDELGQMMGEQRELMEDTFSEAKRQEQQNQSQPGNKLQGLNSGEEGEGQAGESGQGADGQGTGGKGSHPDLRGRQQALLGKLRELMEEMHNAGEEVPSALQEADRSMGHADDRLEQGRPERAAGAQGQALEQMREGAQSMANQMLERMAGGMARSGNSGRGSGSANTDPLGRPSRSSGPDFGEDITVPDEIDAERAREILNELRRRAAEMGRPQIELDYLERLLRRF
ncbi:TIGR02302 family protein [Tepidicaulis sp. LMO-SS28]|uniref:TIGR02302 family protein n=1 Tax=Tepidicaulis sp. LMO-SS28 TaxID=3447455 RepID=UPI003EDF52B2